MLLISITIANSMLLNDNCYQDRHTALVTNDKSLKKLLSCSIAVSDVSLFSEAPPLKSRSLCAGSVSNTQICGESFHEATEAAQPRLFPCLLICLGTHGKVRANQLKVGSHCT